MVAGDLRTSAGRRGVPGDRRTSTDFPRHDNSEVVAIGECLVRNQFENGPYPIKASDETHESIAASTASHHLAVSSLVDPGNRAEAEDLIADACVASPTEGLVRGVPLECKRNQRERAEVGLVVNGIINIRVDDFVDDEVVTLVGCQHSPVPEPQLFTRGEDEDTVAN